MDKDTKKWMGTIFGFLGLMACANALLLTAALQGPGQQLEPNAYAKALDWNATHEAQQKSQALGWALKTELASPDATGTHRLTLTLTDATGAPVLLDPGKVTFVRPSNQRMREEVTLVAQGEGRYEANAKLPAPGLWELQLELHRGADVFLRKERLDIPGPQQP